MQIGKVNALNFGEIYYKVEKGYQNPTEKQRAAIYEIKQRANENEDCIGNLASLDAFAKADIFVIAKKDGNVDVQLRHKLREADKEFNSRHPGRLMMQSTISTKNLKLRTYDDEYTFRRSIDRKFGDFLDEAFAKKCTSRSDY